MHHDQEKLLVYKFLVDNKASAHIKQAFEVLVTAHNRRMFNEPPAPKKKRITRKDIRDMIKKHSARLS